MSLRSAGLWALGLCVVAWACSPSGDDDPRASATRSGGNLRAGKPAEGRAAPPASGRSVPPAPPAPPRSPASFAIAIDQSASMAGFAQTGALEPLIDAAVELSRAGDIARDHVGFFSIGEQTVRVAESALWETGQFHRPRADLARALAAGDIAGADLSVIVTDGQPTSREPSQASCSLQGAEDVGGLAPRLEAALDAGRGIWLVFERVAFDGRFFLNCRALPPEVGKALARRQVRCGAECSYRHRDQRTLLAIVQAAPAFHDAGAHLVERYLADRPGAVAIRLHTTPADRWIPIGAEVEIVGARGAARVPVTGSPGAWQAEIACPARDAGVRICVRARRRAPRAAHAAAALGEARAVVVADREDDLHELAAGAAFTAEQLRSMQSWNYPGCAKAWIRHRELARAAAAPGTCAAGPGEIATTAAIACGCLSHRSDGPHREALELAQPYTMLERDPDWLEPFAASESTWFDQPERIKGLSVLLGAIRRYWSDKVDGKAETIGSLQLLVSPPPR
ncbi:MAG TPA: hypothetical protein VFT22_25625 [Kofleriaceae bacterium]|nr:hypothetical protein [Kofleriaceae bacterium]